MDHNRSWAMLSPFWVLISFTYWLPRFYCFLLVSSSLAAFTLSLPNCTLWLTALTITSLSHEWPHATAPAPANPSPGPMLQLTFSVPTPREPGLLEKGRECVDWLCCRFSSLSRVLSAAHQVSFIFMYWLERWLKEMPRNTGEAQSCSLQRNGHCLEQKGGYSMGSSITYTVA